MARPAEEMLYLAMEDFRVDVIVGKGPGATAIPLEIPPFTLVGATTRAGLLPGPLRDRFGFTAHMDFYAAAELERGAAPLGAAARRAAARRRRRGDRRPVPGDAAHRQPAAAPGPRLRPGRGRRRRSPCEVARAALAVYEVDELGLDRLDRAVLDALCPPLRRRSGRAVHARRRGRRGARDRRGGRRAVPGARRAAGPDAARPGRDAGRLGAPGLTPPRPARCAASDPRRSRACSTRPTRSQAAR